MSDRVCLDVRTNDKSGRALNPSLTQCHEDEREERVENLCSLGSCSNKLGA